MSGCAERNAEQGAGRDSSRPTSPGVVGGPSASRSRGLISPHHKGDEKNLQELPHTKDPPQRREAERQGAIRFVKGKDITADLCGCGGVTNHPHLSGTEGFQGMRDFLHSNWGSSGGGATQSSYLNI